MSKRCDDFYTAFGAAMLCTDIEAYWRKRGYDGIRAVRFEIAGSPGHFGVRSNLGPTGYPPRTVAAG